MNNFQEVKSRVGILDYMSKHGKVVKVSGRIYRLDECPFCQSHNGFTIRPQSNTWHCYGSCGLGGSIIDFASNLYKETEYEALIRIAGEYNINIEVGQVDNSVKTKLEIFKKAELYYRNNLTTEQKKFLKEKRKRTDNIIAFMHYGGATGDLHKFLKKEGFGVEEMISSGLVCKAEDGRIYDFFSKGRIIYPFYKSSSVVDFSGKDYFASDKKNKNRQLLYGFRLRDNDFFGESDFYKDKIIFVEGEEDRIAVIQALVGNADKANTRLEFGVIACLGGLSPEQLSKLQNKAEGREYYLAFDNDKEGANYIEKASIACLGGKGYPMIIEFEEHDIDDHFKVFEGDARKEVYDLVENAKSYMEYEIERLPVEDDTLSEKAKLGMLNRIVSLLEYYEENPLLFEKYKKLLASKISGKEYGSMAKVTKAIEIMLIKLKQLEENIDGMPTGDEWNIIKDTKKNRYFKRQKGGMFKIADFTIDIISTVYREGLLEYEVILTNSRGKISNPVIMSGDARSSVRIFTKLLADTGEYHFYGKDVELSEIWYYEEVHAKVDNEIHVEQRIGWLKKHKVFLFHNCAFKDGKLYKAEEDGTVYVGKKGLRIEDVNVYNGVKALINIEETPTKAFIEEVISHFHAMWDCRGEHDNEPYTSFKAYMQLGYLASSIYLPELTSGEGKHPFFFVYGASDSGKSEAIKLLLQCAGFDAMGESYDTWSLNAMSTVLEQISCLPVWADEYNNDDKPIQKARILLLKSAYNRMSETKGGLNSKRKTREVNASLIISGQDRVDEYAVLSRGYTVHKPTYNAKGTRSYYWLKSQRDRLSLVVRWLIENKNRETAKELLEERKRIYKFLSERNVKVKDRTLFNIATVASGFSIFGYKKYYNEFLEWLAIEAIEDTRRKSSEEVLSRFFGDIEIMYKDQEYLNYVKVDEMGVHIFFKKLFSDWKKHTKLTNMTERISEGGLRDYILKSDMYVPQIDNRVSIQGIQRRCLLLDPTKAPENLQALFEQWAEDSKPKPVTSSGWGD
jgi:DNA primase catalytic core